MSTTFSFILLFGISGGEIFVVLLLILILFGPKKIPEIARTIGKGMNEIKKVQRDINAEINRYSREMESPVKQIKEDIEGFNKGINEQVAATFDDPTVVAPDIESQAVVDAGDITAEKTSTGVDHSGYPYLQHPDNTDVAAQESKEKDEPESK
jgi:sec-independent protein translocase protein TatA